MTRTNASNRQTQWIGLVGQTVGANVETRIASSGGNQVYVFSDVGKHVRTVYAKKHEYWRGSQSKTLCEAAWVLAQSTGSRAQGQVL